MARKARSSFNLSSLVLADKHEGFEGAWWRQEATGKDQAPRVGRTAGYLGKGGYVWVDIGGVEIRADAIAWYLYYQEWPERELAHLNGDRADNRIHNLQKKEP
jgi:hypothetical protein